MAQKHKLYYFNGRGRMEQIRWLLAAAGVEFEEEFFETREQYEKLLQDGFFLFQQTPMVEIDGMKLVQTRAILRYIATKYNLYGTNLKERALAFKTRISHIPTIKKFLEPGSQRKPIPDGKYMETVRNVLQMYHQLKPSP
ncbi:glutathione S-transferase 3-like [Erythrolamprus reginae]|uniref:glutathione S-transferase 3-like n=1 Tax=Erythrolamprus reginae TaxID=121349 RepID=UPI00396CA138